MGEIGIIGGGTAGLQLALLLQKNGVEPVLYAERTADDVRAGRLPNTVIHNHRTRTREQALGVNHWDQTGLDIQGHWHHIPGERPLSFPGYFEAPSLGVDYRIYQSALLEDFEQRGGRVTYGGVSAEQIATLSARHELLVVCTGRGGFGSLFPPIAGRSPFDAPARWISAGLYTGIDHDSDLHYVTLSIAPPHGEFIEAPMQTFGGNVSVLLFECIPGGDFEAIARMPYADDPKAHDRKVLELVRAHNPVIYERIDTTSFGVTRAQDVLQGAVTPTVRQSYAELDGVYAIALGDAHVTIDPVCGLGANAASFAAFTLGEAILEGRPFDEGLCRVVDERRLPMVLASFDFTNFMLNPQPHLFDVIGAMSTDLALASDFTDGFTEPVRQWGNLASAEAAAAYVGKFGGGTERA